MPGGAKRKAKKMRQTVKAYHITSKENFDAIHRDGFIRPRTEKRRSGEQGSGFAADWHAQDNQFVFFSPSDFYQTLTDGTDAYGFVYDAEYLIFGLSAFVGPDLLTKYDDLMHTCAQQVAEKLGPKPIDEVSLQAFLKQNEITDAGMIAAIRKDEGSYYQDVLNGMLNSDKSVTGAMDGLKMFREKVGEIQDKHRTTGEKALQILRNPVIAALGTPLEILVPVPVPIEARMHCIIAGKESIL